MAKRIDTRRLHANPLPVSTATSSSSFFHLSFNQPQVLMVGLFSRFSTRTGHRRTQSALDERQVLSSNPEVASLPTVASHGIEVAVEFKPVEHPVEPLDNDQPVQCPLPEPSILNDGRIWKERISASVRRRPDLPVMTEGVPLETEVDEIKVRQPQSKRSILPSASAPEHSLLKLLEECNTSGI